VNNEKDYGGYFAYVSAGTAGSYARAMDDVSEEDYLEGLASEAAGMSFIALVHVKPSLPFNHRGNTELRAKAAKAIQAEALKKYALLDGEIRKIYAHKIEEIKSAVGR
jgi:hypothetical protein